MKKSLVLGALAMMSMADASDNRLEAPLDYSRPTNIYKTGLTKKQQKAREASKRAAKARKLNYENN